MSKTYCDTH